MKSAKLIYNPKAGEGADPTQNIITILKKAGYECSLSSTKEEGWEKLDAKETDLIIVAGGDGTVRKVAFEFLDKRLPIGLLPLGTANNIAKTLELEEEPEDIIAQWDLKKIKRFDVGRIYNLKDQKFFIEGLGFGVFPRLMKEMQKITTRKDASTDKKIKTALEILHDIVLDYEARKCTIQIDDAEHSGNYLMAEVMNTRSIGPNLNLVPFSDPGDGQFEVVLIAESQREQFANYILSKIMGKEEPAFFSILKAKKLKIYWEGVHLHVDDEYIKFDKATEIKIELQEDAVHFLTTRD
jgi:diacylglycerol kinase (ATP)